MLRLHCDFHLEGRKESAFWSPWRLVACPWPASCCGPVDGHKPSRVLTADLVQPEEKNESTLESETLAGIFARADERCGERCESKIELLRNCDGICISKTHCLICGSN